MPQQPLPTKIKVLRGNPGKKRLPKPGEEPEPELFVEVPDPPDWLGEYGVKEWYRVAPHLVDLGLLTEADYMAFATYCQNVHMLVESSLDIEKNGTTIRGSRGDVRNPALATFTACTGALRSMAGEFGMTPSSRARIRLPDDSGETLDDLVGGKEEAPE